jgi:hypothetical protein
MAILRMEDFLFSLVFANLNPEYLLLVMFVFFIAFCVPTPNVNT